MFPTDIVSCHPAAVPRVGFNSPDWVSIHVLHQPQPGIWLSKKGKSKSQNLSPVQELAHHQLLLLERATAGGGNLHPSAAVVVASPQQPF